MQQGLTELRSEMQQGLAEVRSEMHREISRLDLKIESLKTELHREFNGMWFKLVGLFIGQAGLIVALVKIL